LVGGDESAQALRQCRANLKLLDLPRDVVKYDFACTCLAPPSTPESFHLLLTPFRLHQGDFERTARRLSLPPDTCFFSNLPYGVRSGSDTHLLHARLGSLLASLPALRPAFVVAPTAALRALSSGLPPARGRQGKSAPVQLQWEQVLSFSNGGLPVALFALRK
jgi:hypothetical protein